MADRNDNLINLTRPRGSGRRELGVTHVMRYALHKTPYYSAPFVSLLSTLYYATLYVSVVANDFDCQSVCCVSETHQRTADRCCQHPSQDRGDR
jgi:hypothetical protein